MSAPAIAVDYSPAATLARLRELFSRGRVERQGDGMPILVARAKALAGTHVYEQAPGRLLALFYRGSPRRWLNLLGDLVVQHLAGDGEGVLHVTWSAEAARRLRAFSRGRQRAPGAPQGPRLVPGNGSGSAAGGGR